MPGKRLNDNERRLSKVWRNPPKNQIYLRSIELSGGTGLRGIDGLIVRFRYPITAICGGNGVGKTTLLALAALAYHSPEGWFVHWGNTRSHHTTHERTYYTFPDFFINGPGESQVSGVSVTWRHQLDGRELSVTFAKSRNRWGHYTERPERAVDFLPIGRVLPAHEVSGVRTTFLQSSRVDSEPLNVEFREHLSFIMGKEYAKAEFQRSKRYTFQRAAAGAEYTGFNMGGGESCMIELLYLLQRLPRGGLLVVEEMEVGLHPQAQKRLAAVLVRICLQKQLQIICSTHSEPFLDALPREARLLIKRTGDEHVAFESPSTRFALYEMTGEPHPELIIYCEDRVAAILIEEALEALNHYWKVRVEILDVGNNKTVIQQCVAHARASFRMRSLGVLDGDCKKPDIQQWINSARGNNDDIDPDYILLPGDGLPPEKWVLEQLKHEDYEQEFARHFRCKVSEASGYVQDMRVQPRHHNIWHTLSQRTGIDQIDCIRRTMRSFALRHPQLDNLRTKVSQLLDE